jgi:ABC-type multidrug transport system permease subunit
MSVLAAIRKELLEITHDRTMMAVLLVFPVFIMLFMGSSFRAMEINGLPIGVAGSTDTTLSGDLFSQLNESAAFKLRSFGTEEEAMTAFKDGQLRAVILVPQDFEDSLQTGRGAEIRVVVDNSDLALEQSVLAAMSSVIEASSANITKSYVSGAWRELEGLNASASSLEQSIAESRAKMQQTKTTLGDIRQNIDTLQIDSLGSSLDNASAGIAGLQETLAEQKAAIQGYSAANSGLLDRSGLFIYNASQALNQSIDTVADTHGKLGSQTQSLNDSIHALDASIAGLEAIKAGSSDNTTIAALELNIASLQTLRNSTAGQLSDAQDQMAELESLNDTLYAFSDELSNYSAELAAARGGQADPSALSGSIDSISARLSSMNSSFASARTQVEQLKGLLSDIRNTSSQIDATLDDALNQTASVDSLLSSLKQTVAEQTARDPDIIASPLSVKVEDQYQGGSFVDFIMPQIIALSLLLSCFLLASISIVREKTRNTIIRSLMVGRALAELVAGKIASLVLLSFGQVAVILIVALLLFGVQPPRNLVMLFWGTLISSLVLSSIGTLIGFYARSESAAIQSCLLIAIPMLFLGNIIFSPDLLPTYTQILQQLLPLAHVTSIYKIVLITDGNPAVDIGALIVYFVALAGLLAIIVTKRREITDYS